jgi:hypothetical protein
MKITKVKTKADSVPLAARNCIRVRHNRRPCDSCGATRPVLHTPIRAAGRYCAACCPHCTPASLPKPFEPA